MTTNIGFLHTGNMGITLAATARNSGNKGFWFSQGRSVETRSRAEAEQLTEVSTLQGMIDQCPVIVSCCPPHAAESVAELVKQSGFQGLYVDVNAIAPMRTRSIAQYLSASGIEFVDGGIIGPPARQPDTTVLYLSGPRAAEIAEYFYAGPMGVEVMGTDIGKASALKMCFAANSKGTTALLSAILATAEQFGVREELTRHWSRNGSDFADKTEQSIGQVTAKAWRFSGEMEEIAATFAAAGLPDGFHQAAADVYRRLAQFKGAEPEPGIDEILQALLEPNPE